MIRRPPRSTQGVSSAASDVYKRQSVHRAQRHLREVHGKERKMGKKSAPAAQSRSKPNILITGTPGTGKSSLAERVASAASFTQYDVSAVAKEEKLCAEYDEELDTYVIDEDKVLDHMEERLGGEHGGGHVVDYHSCDLFPERWFDLVVVLTCDNSELYERLKSVSYTHLTLPTILLV